MQEKLIYMPKIFIQHRRMSVFFFFQYCAIIYSLIIASFKILLILHISLKSESF